MTKILRIVLAGIASLAAATCQAQTTSDPLFFAGVVGAGPQSMLSVQGTIYAFPADGRPTYASVLLSPFATSVDYGIGGSLDGNLNYDVMSMTQVSATTEPTFQSGTVNLSNGTAVVGTQDIYAVVFSTAVHRDAFLYYVQQREAAATELDYDYYTTLAAYEFWMGQEDEGLALYSYYTGMADYIRERDFDTDPQQAMYDYHYNIGLGAYYYFIGIGDEESANLAFYYHYQLAVAALEEPPAEM